MLISGGIKTKDRGGKKSVSQYCHKERWGERRHQAGVALCRLGYRQCNHVISSSKYSEPARESQELPANELTLFNLIS